jgi:zinc finger protein
MNREVVKTDSATTRIPELDFEIPAFSQKGGEF